MKKRIAILTLLAAALLLTACTIYQKLDKIDVAQAQSVAMNALGISGEELSYMAAELKDRDGTPYYEVKLTVDGTDYMFAIDAMSGVIIEQTPAQAVLSEDGTEQEQTAQIASEMNIPPANPVDENPVMEIIQPPIGDGPVIYLTPAEVNYPILDFEKREITEGTRSSTDVLNVITSDSGYTRTEIKVLARFFTPVGSENATHVYFTTPDGKYFYYAVGFGSLKILRRETADDLSGLSHPLRDSATEVIMPEGMISIEEAYGYALRVNEVYDFDKQTVRTVWEDDVILYVAEADYRNGEYEYDFIYQEKETGWFSNATVRASDGAIRLCGRGLWKKGYFGGFENMTAVKLSAYQAKTLALSYVPGAKQSDITAFTTDNADGKMEYIGKIVYGGMQFDFTIDGYSGAIRAWKAAPAV